MSGFWSKDEIFAGLHDAASGKYYQTAYLVLLAVAILVAGLTAFYTTRAYVLTFLREEKIPPEAGHHAHESPPVMTIPLMILALFAVGIGIIVEPFTHWFSHTLEHYTLGLAMKASAEAVDWGMMGAGILAVATGIGVAWWMYIVQPDLPGRISRQMYALYELSTNKFYLDDLYDAAIVRPLEGFAEFCRIGDLNILDSLVDLVGCLPALAGRLFRPVQNGLVQFYALAMVLGLAVFLLFLATR